WLVSVKAESNLLEKAKAANIKDTSGFSTSFFFLNLGHPANSSGPNDTGSGVENLGLEPTNADQFP
ncbi:9756_t:CDS:1, partial [Dentiscutata erythropus]